MIPCCRLPPLFILIACALPLHANAEESAHTTRIFARYQGDWNLVTHRRDAAPGTGETRVRIQNTCAEVGMFEVCQQHAGDGPPVLVVYTEGQGAEIFHSTVLTADGRFQQAGEVHVCGDRWEYPWEESTSTGSRRLYRVVNAWDGANHIRFRKEFSDGKEWTVLESGDEWKVASPSHARVSDVPMRPHAARSDGCRTAAPPDSMHRCP